MIQQFKRDYKIDQDNRVGKLVITIDRCFSPSTIFYDEFVEAKGKGTELFSLLTYICSIHGDSREDRPLEVLLSGTPMPQGPVGLESVLPLISVGADLYNNMGKLKAAYTKAFHVVDEGGIRIDVEQETPTSHCGEKHRCRFSTR